MKHLNQDIFELKSDNNSGEIAKLQRRVDAFESALNCQREEGEEKFATKTDVEQKNAELVAEVKKLQEALANLQNQQDRTGVTQKYVDDALDRVRQQLQDFVKKEDIPDNLQTTLNATDEKIKYLESLVAQCLPDNNVGVQSWVNKISKVDYEVDGRTHKVTLKATLKDVNNFDSISRQISEFFRAVVYWHNQNPRRLDGGIVAIGIDNLLTLDKVSEIFVYYKDGTLKKVYPQS